MEPPRFYYSTDGTDSHGPVDQAELRQLLLSDRIGPKSFVCREGETTWEPLSPEVFGSVSVDAGSTEEKTKLPPAIIFACVVGALVVAFFAITPGHPPSQPNVPPVASSNSTDPSEDLGMPPNVKSTAQNSLRLKDELQKIQSEEFGNSALAARFVRALVSIGGELPAEVEATRKKEEHSTFAVQSDNNPAALATQLSDLRDLRDIETDLVVYLQDFDSHFGDDMTANDIPIFAQARLTDIVHRRLRIDLHLALWQAKLDFTKDDISRLNFLEKNSGQWKLKDRKVVFTDATLRATHEQALNAVREDLKKISKVMDDLAQGN